VTFVDLVADGYGTKTRTTSSYPHAPHPSPMFAPAPTITAPGIAAA
jgi:hypothetical protein